MDATTEYLSGYACRLTYEEIPRGVVHQVKRTLADTLGCAMGGFDSEPWRIAWRLASRVSDAAPARILGTRESTAPDLASFVNTVLVRYLDCNDTYAARGTGHPSDMIPAVLALADSLRADGRAVIEAITVAYEVFCRLVDHVPLHGWDQGIYAAIGAACGAGRILGLDQVSMGNAISLAITPSLPLGVTRVGELSMWKGCATAAATRGAVFAAQLAAEGMTGPGHPFEGRDGLWQHMGVAPPNWGLTKGRDALFRITGTTFKAFPAVVHSQGPIGLVLGLRQQVPVDEIDAVRVETYGEAIRRTAAEPEKWAPKTRETADHSIPYLVAAAFLDGAVSPATFTTPRLQDPALRALMSKLTVVEDPDFTRRYPAESCTRIEVITTAGRRLLADTNHPKGHYRNPLTDAEVEGKFRELAEGALPSSRCDEALAQIWALDQLPGLDALFESLVVEGAAPGQV
ncbi:MAG: MmgE/PrpD family protein [Chloroflexi bacterium]|nr:MmgE/PrpD family protein [Chloroflexota bacterium]